MGWMISEGIDGDGARFIARIDDAYSKVAARQRRANVVHVRVSGEQILKSGNERKAFEEFLDASLAPFGGVYAASYSRAHPHESYTWLYYAARDVEPHEVPIPSELAARCHVAVARDPKWREYESLNPPRPSLAQRALRWFKHAFTFSRGIQQMIDGDETDADIAVLNAMARDGANLSKETDVVFYLLFEHRENAADCARELWDQHFRAEVLMPPPAAPDETGGGQWLVRARRDLVPELTTIRAAVAVMKTSASQNNGVFDGWEAAVER